MPETFLDNLANPETGQKSSGFAVAPGIVTNNIDLAGLGRVQVKVATRPSFEPWARLVAPGGASGRGFMWVPNIDDEVLIAFAENDTSSAYVLGGVWSMLATPPLVLPNDTLSKRVIVTGLTEGLGHTLEFDDALQSVTITTSTKQKISLDPLAITISNLAGTASIKLDNTEQAITITAANKIELDAIQIAMKATSIDMSAAKVSITSGGPCTVQGLPIKLN